MGVAAAWIVQKPMRRKIGKFATAHGLSQGYVADALIRQSLDKRLEALKRQKTTLGR